MLYEIADGELQPAIQGKKHSQLALLGPTVVGTTIDEPASGIAVDAVPPSLEIGLMGLGVIGNTTVSSD